MGEAALADTPLSLLSNRMLAAVLDKPGITVTEMSRRIPKTQQAISHVAAQLTKLGLIERRLGSGRGVELYVTEAGRRMAEEGRAREHGIQIRLRELLGDARYEALEELSGETGRFCDRPSDARRDDSSATICGPPERGIRH